MATIERLTRARVDVRTPDDLSLGIRGKIVAEAVPL
jgi:hypothetical protein